MSGIFSRNEWQWLRQNIDYAHGVPYRPIIELMYFYCRRSETILNLQIENVDLDKGLITFDIEWHNDKYERLFELDDRLAESIVTTLQFNQCDPQAKDTELFDITYSSLYGKMKSASKNHRRKFELKNIRQSRVAHLEDEGYHPAQIESWMLPEPSDLDSQTDASSFVRAPLSLPEHDLYGNSPDIPRSRDAFNRMNPRTGFHASLNNVNKPPVPSVVEPIDSDHRMFLVDRSIPGTIAYQIRTFIYNTNGDVSIENIIQYLRKTNSKGSEIVDDRVRDIIGVLSSYNDLANENGQVTWDGPADGWT